MPPASLSTLAVMMPGPTTASTMPSRAQRPGRAFTPPDGVARTSNAPPCGLRPSPAEPAPPASAMQDFLQHVVHRDHAEQLAVLLHRQREEVVLGGQLGHLARRVLGR